MKWSKIGAFGDIHFGEHGDDVQHNQYCLEYLDWFLKECEDRCVDLIVFLGDWNHSRSKLGVETLTYSEAGLRKLSDFCKKQDIRALIDLGNHDLFFKDSREIHSLPFIHKYENLVLVDKPTRFGDIAVVPWLVSTDDIESVVRTCSEASYVFGHFELPGFLMNSMVAYQGKPGHLDGEMFQGPQYVFSGHFHKRQKQRMKNGVEIHYIGNPFPHNFSDEGDTSRGAMFLERFQEPEYADWPGMPTYHSVLLSELGDETFMSKINSRSTVRAVQDIALSPEDVVEIKSTMAQEYGLTNLTIEPGNKGYDKDADVKSEDFDELDMQTIDQIVVDWIRNEAEFEGTNYDREYMVRVFIETPVT